MIYFLLLLHFGFNVFFIMCFAAFIFASTQKKSLEILSIVYLSIYSILELIGVSILLVNGFEKEVWFIWLVAVIITSIISLILYSYRKLDLTIWGPFSIIFGPLIIIPILVSLPIINKQSEHH